MSNWGAADSHSHVYLLRVPTPSEFAAGHYGTATRVTGGTVVSGGSKALSPVVVIGGQIAF